MALTKRQYLFVLSLNSIIFTFLVIGFYPKTKYSSNKPTFNENSATTRTIHILYWTTMFDRKDFYLGLGSEIFKNCKYKNCLATSDRHLKPVEEFDAILFHGAERSIWRRFGKPPKRSPSQVYIYSNQESPSNSPRVPDAENFFNWTMSYRTDSDIPRVYAYIEEKGNFEGAPEKTLRAVVANKTKLVAWMVSNCVTASRREILVNEMAKLIPVDVFGSCGEFECPKTEKDTCYSMLEDTYKFYLSFENSMCTDYVTEKLYNVLGHNLVPIVFGSGNYTKLAPPTSVINVKDFQKVEDLVEHMKFLDGNTDEYLKYFEWKSRFQVNLSNDLCLCTLCEKLNQPRTEKTYQDINEWWFGKDNEMCH